METKNGLTQIEYRVIIKLLSGLHIGGNQEGINIGGLDKPVIRNPLNKEPYIPGSSLKGKIRSLLQQQRSETNNTYEKDDKSIICKWFGGLIREKAKNSNQEEENSNQEEENPKESTASKIIFRDAVLTKKSKQELESCDDLDFPYTEIKFETAICRITGSAKTGSLRQIERVPAGTRFRTKIIVNINCNKGGSTVEEQKAEAKKLIEEGLELLKKSALGGSGSRGYGQIDYKIKEWSDEPKSSTGKDDSLAEPKSNHENTNH